MPADCDCAFRLPSGPASGGGPPLGSRPGGHATGWAIHSPVGLHQQRRLSLTGRRVPNTRYCRTWQRTNAECASIRHGGILQLLVSRDSDRSCFGASLPTADAVTFPRNPPCDPERLPTSPRPAPHPGRTASAFTPSVSGESGSLTSHNMSFRNAIPPCRSMPIPIREPSPRAPSISNSLSRA
jgi:hypothetical protein